MIRFFFHRHDGTLINLPVNPEALVIQSQGNNGTVEVINLGEISILRNPKLRKVDISSFFPLYPAPYVVAVGELHTPDYYVDFFEHIKNSKQPCRLVVTDTKVNMLVSIEEFNYGYEAMDNDLKFKLSLKEYVPYTSKVVELVMQTAPVATDQVNAPVAVPTVSNTVASPSSNNTARPSNGFAVGDTVNAWGTYYGDSYGGGSKGSFSSGFKGKITLIVADTSRAYRYHISTLSGGARGWVSGGQISGA